MSVPISRRLRERGWQGTYQNASAKETETADECERLAGNPALAVCDRAAEDVDIGAVAREVVEGFIQSTERREPGERDEDVD
jgi:hypothetical protein